MQGLRREVQIHAGKSGLPCMQIEPCIRSECVKITQIFLFRIEYCFQYFFGVLLA